MLGKRYPFDAEAVLAKPLVKYAAEWWSWTIRRREQPEDRRELVPAPALCQAFCAAVEAIAGTAARLRFAASPVVRAVRAAQGGAGVRKAPTCWPSQESGTFP